MVEIKEVLRLWKAGTKKKRIATQATVDVKTVRRYIAAAKDCGLVPGPEPPRPVPALPPAASSTNTAATPSARVCERTPPSNRRSAATRRGPPGPHRRSKPLPDQEVVCASTKRRATSSSQMPRAPAITGALRRSDTHVPRPGGVGALDVQDRQLQLVDGNPLLDLEVLDLHDPVRLVELEGCVEQADEQVLAVLGAEDALEDEVRLEIGEHRPHRTVSIASLIAARWCRRRSWWPSSTFEFRRALVS